MDPRVVAANGDEVVVLWRQRGVSRAGDRFDGEVLGPVAEWLPVLARALGAKPPRRVPAFLAWLALGELGITLATRVCGASNAKARRQLGWKPAHASWRDGFQEALAG